MKNMTNSFVDQPRLVTPIDKNFVSCEDCAMNPVCQPVELENKTLTLADNYLQRRITIKSGQVLFKQNETLTAIYAVSSGGFKLQKASELHDDKIIGFRLPGELLGEDALFNQQYQQTAIAIENSSVCIVDVEPLISCSKVVPQVQSQINQLLIKQAYVNQREFVCLVAKKSAESMVASFLLNLLERTKLDSLSEQDITLSNIGLPNKKSTNMKLLMSRDNLANFLGLRRETLSRILSKFQKEQLINLQGKNITLVEVSKLISLSNL